MAQMTFGDVLRDAREQQGMNLSFVARKLRIRPEILRAIEANDFSRMPPRGYTRNMVNAYARLLGLNPTEMTRMYLDEAYAQQNGGFGSTRGEYASAHRSTGSSRAAFAGAVSALPPAGRSSRDTEYGARRSSARSGVGDGVRMGDTARMERVDRDGRSGRGARRFYASPKTVSALQGKVPLIIAGAVILILLIVVLVLAFGNRQPANTGNTPVVPVTGLTDTTAQQNGDQSSDSSSSSQTTTETAPSSVKVTYKIASGTTVYAVINDNGATTTQIFNGGEEQSFDVTGTWSFSTWVTDGVSITVGDQKVSFDSKDASGMPMVSVTYTTWLQSYLKEHPNAKAPEGVDLSAANASSGTNSADASASANNSSNTATTGLPDSSSTSNNSNGTSGSTSTGATASGTSTGTSTGQSGSVSGASGQGYGTTSGSTGSYGQSSSYGQSGTSGQTGANNSYGQSGTSQYGTGSQYGTYGY